MTDILLINPGDRPKPGKSKGVRKMAKKKSIVKKNPSKAGALARRGGRRMFGGLNPKKAVTDAAVGQPGILMAQFFAKRFGAGKGWFDPNWTWENYAWAVGGSFVAGLAGNLVMPGKGQKMVEHGLGMTLNKFLQDKVVQPSPILKSALGNVNNRLSARYANPQSAQSAMRLNPPRSANLRGIYGQRQSQPTMGYGPGQAVMPEGPLGGDMTPANYLGNRPFKHAFIEN